MASKVVRILDRLIYGSSAPKRGEIKNDAFSQCIERIAATEGVSTILEIGASTGDGSTAAFVRGMKRNPGQPTLFAMEAMKDRFEVLQRRYAEHPNVKCYNVSSIAIEDFPSESYVTDFYRSIRTALNQQPLETVLGWLRSDIQYVREHQIPTRGIEMIKRENHITTFDVVLIDGSEFTGEPELREVLGARFLLLDDTNAFKNHATCLQLLANKDYRLVESVIDLRSGYAVFERV